VYRYVKQRTRGGAVGVVYIVTSSNVPELELLALCISLRQATYMRWISWRCVYRYVKQRTRGGAVGVVCIYVKQRT